MSTNDSGASLVDLEMFVAVADGGGFTAAARRLGVSKALASTAIARLEERVGVRLFQRTTRRITLTEAGAAALPHARRAILAARDAHEAATRLRASPRGTLRVSAPMSFGLLHVVPALGAFAQAYPELKVDLALDDRMIDLVEGAFDLAVRIGTLADSSLVAQRLGRSRSALVAHPDYLARRGVPEAPAELADHDALLYTLAPICDEWTLVRGGRTERLRVRGPLQANSSLALRQAALQGLGIARIPLFVVGEDLASGRLIRVLPDWEPPENGIYAITTSREHLPAKTRAFIDFFRSRIGEPAYWEPPRHA